MALRRISGECEDGLTCPGVWVDDQFPQDVIIVGTELDPSPVPLGPGERAVRLSRQISRTASIGM